jgi:hypothetical protein
MLHLLLGFRSLRDVTCYQDGPLVQRVLGIQCIAELVKLPYFAGLSIEQAGDALGIPHRTAYRNWAHARSWLSLEITKGDAMPPSD